MRKGCNLCDPFIKSEGSGRRSRNFPMVREFVDVFPEELPGMPPKRELEFTIDLKPGTETDSKNALSYVDPEVTRS
jgi:hypothetical protein